MVATLTIFSPAYNEEAIIGRTVASATELGRTLTQAGDIDDYEILVVDDASTDRTPALVDQLAIADPHVRVVHHDQNRGLGGAIRTGLEQAKGDVVLYTDADLPFDLLEGVKALRLMRAQDAGVVAAYRLDRTGEGLRRYVYSHLYNWLVRAVVGVRVRDVNFAGKLIRRDVIDHVQLHSEGSFIDVELLAKADRLGYRTIQFGVDYFPRSRGVSTLSSRAVIANILREMWVLLPEIRALGRRSEIH